MLNPENGSPAGTTLSQCPAGGAAAVDGRPTIWVDIDDLVRHFETSYQPTGIQRVVSEILMAGRASLGQRVRLCRFNARSGRLEPFDPAALADIVMRAGLPVGIDSRRGRLHSARAFARHAAFIVRNRMRSVLHDRFGSRARERAFAARVRPGDVLVNLGATWGHPGFAARLAEAKRRYGLRYAMMVHDIIPAAHPELCTPGNVANFLGWIDGTGRATDLFFTPSRYSAAALAAFGRAQGWPDKLVRPVRFGTGFHDWADGSGDATSVVDGPFVLTVSTIEIRKNHRLLVQVWRRLIERHGPDAVPTLVFIGKIGWRVEELMEELRASKYLGGKIVIAAAVSNATLAACYRSCLFTVFPSLTEGWGLPVEESFFYGKHCICSDAGSIPEVGGPFADYFASDNADEARALIERALFEPGFLAAREERLRAGFRPADWADTFGEIVSVIDAELPAGAAAVSRS